VRTFYGKKLEDGDERKKQRRRITRRHHGVIGRPNPARLFDRHLTVLLKSIRQSRVTGVLDVTNFVTLSRVTQALDEYTFLSR
jgi:hypothetical protein